MRKIKVLMLGNHPFVKGGIASVISQLLEHDWDSDGVEMHFIPTYMETNNIKKISYFAAAYLKILRDFLINKPDVVHIHMSYKGSFKRKYAIHKLCKYFGIRDIIHLHGSEFKKWFDESDNATQDKIRSLLRECDSFVVLGDKWNRAVKQIEPDTNIIVVSNTVHVPKEMAKWEIEKFQVLFLGVLIKRKGVADLLQAIHLLVQSGRIHNLHFVIAGIGDEEAALKKQCTELQLEPYVSFAGWTVGDKKDRLLQESQMLVLPSYNEGLPIAILEAISYGLPVVATDVGDISAAVKNDVNGYLVQSGDVNALAQGIEKIAVDQAIYEKMGQASRNLAETQFSDETYYAKLRECYQHIGEINQ